MQKKEKRERRMNSEAEFIPEALVFLKRRLSAIDTSLLVSSHWPSHVILGTMPMAACANELWC